MQKLIGQTALGFVLFFLFFFVIFVLLAGVPCKCLTLRLAHKIIFQSLRFHWLYECTDLHCLMFTLVMDQSRSVSGTHAESHTPYSSSAAMNKHSLCSRIVTSRPLEGELLTAVSVREVCCHSGGYAVSVW